MENVCKVCGSKWVVNKTHKLCDQHNKERLNEQKEKETNYVLEEVRKNLKGLITSIYIVEKCSKCGNNQVENKTHKLCHQCNIERIHKVPYKEYTQAKINKQVEHNREKEKETPTKPIRQISPNNKNIQKDAKFFREIWSTRPHVSQVSGQDLGDEFSAYYCSHILTKGAYPGFRHKAYNIKLVTKKEHDLWEFGDRKKLSKDPKWDWVFKREEELIRLYYKK